MTSPYLSLPIRSREEAMRDTLIERLATENAKLRNLQLDDPRRGECIRVIRALDAQLDGLNDLLAT